MSACDGMTSRQSVTVTSENPYAPPESVDAARPRQPLALREIVLAWEKLRLIYNGVLLIPGVLILALWVQRLDLPVGAAVVGGMMVGLGANVAFLLGPLSELYLRGLFFNGESMGWGRWLIFGSGLVVSGGVFLSALVVGMSF
ncbi:MAG: hypothetical protein ACQKBU_09345 [Verrucomicrobiales bacterium]